MKTSMLFLIFWIIWYTNILSQTKLTDFIGEESNSVRFMDVFNDSIYLIESLSNDKFLISNLEDGNTVSSYEIDLTYFSRHLIIEKSKTKLFYSFGGKIFSFQPSSRSFLTIEDETNALILNKVINDEQIIFTNTQSKLSILLNIDTNEKFELGNNYQDFKIIDQYLFCLRFTDVYLQHIVEKVDIFDLDTRQITYSVNGNFLKFRYLITKEKIIYSDFKYLFSYNYASKTTDTLREATTASVYNMHEENGHFLIFTFEVDGTVIEIYNENFELLSKSDFNNIWLNTFEIDYFENLIQINYGYGNVLFNFSTKKWQLEGNRIILPYLITQNESEVIFTHLLNDQKFNLGVQESQYFNKITKSDSNRIFIEFGLNKVSTFNQEGLKLNEIDLLKHKSKGIPDNSYLSLIGQEIFLNNRRDFSILKYQDIATLSQLNEPKESKILYLDDELFFHNLEGEYLVLRQYIRGKLMTVATLPPQSVGTEKQPQRLRKVILSNNNLILHTDSQQVFFVDRKTNKIVFEESQVRDGLIMNEDGLYAIIKNKLKYIDPNLNVIDFPQFQFNDYESLLYHKLGSDLYLVLMNPLDSKKSLYKVSSATFIKDDKLSEKAFSNLFKDGNHIISVFSREFSVFTPFGWKELDYDWSGYVIYRNYIILKSKEGRYYAYEPKSNSKFWFPSIFNNATIIQVESVSDHIQVISTKNEFRGFPIFYKQENHEEISFFKIDKSFVDATLLYRYLGFPSINSLPLIFTIDGIKVLDNNFNTTDLALQSDSYTDKNVKKIYGQYYFLAQDNIKNRQIYAYAPMDDKINLENTKQISVFPNPTWNFISIDSEWQDCSDYSVLNYEGQKINIFKSYPRLIDVSQLIPGNYVIICNCKGEIKKGAFIKL